MNIHYKSGRVYYFVVIFLRGFEGRDHFYAILISLKRRGLEEDIGRYSNFKANKCTVELQISERFWLGMIIGDTEFIFVSFIRNPESVGLFLPQNTG